MSDHAIIVERSVEVNAPATALWASLMTPARWWAASQTWSGDSRNLTLAPRPGGCLCETLTDGGFVEHLRVVRAEPGRLLRMTGALGPLQADAVTGPLTVTLAPAGQGTRMTWRYAVSGAARMPLPLLAPILDKLIVEQAERLAALAEGRALVDHARSGAISPK